MDINSLVVPLQVIFSLKINLYLFHKKTEHIQVRKCLHINHFEDPINIRIKKKQLQKGFQLAADKIK